MGKPLVRLTRILLLLPFVLNVCAPCLDSADDDDVAEDDEYDEDEEIAGKDMCT